MSTTTKTRRTFASVCHEVAERFGLDPERVGVLAVEAGCKRVRDEKRLVEAVEAWIAAEAARQDDTPKADATPKQPRAKQPGLTLSQRRALLRLLDAEDGIAPATAFKALPYDHAVECGYATRDEHGVYRLTDAGTVRAESVNPGYRVWASGETVAGDDSRPPAGTARGIFDIDPTVDAS
jgi:hypothetical protein